MSFCCDLSTFNRLNIRQLSSQTRAIRERAHIMLLSTSHFNVHYTSDNTRQEIGKNQFCAQRRSDQVTNKVFSVTL